MEQPAINDVIILGVVLEEVRHRNNAIYTRLRALIADPDRRFFVFSNEHHKYAVAIGTHPNPLQPSHPLPPPTHPTHTTEKHT